MQRRNLLTSAAAGTAGALAAAAVTTAQTTFNWRMTSFYGPQAAFYSTGPGSAKDLVDRIQKMSSNQIHIQFFGAQFAAVAVVYFAPRLATWLPRAIGW